MTSRRRRGAAGKLGAALAALVLAACANGSGDGGQGRDRQPVPLADQVLAVGVGPDGYSDGPPVLPLFGKVPLDAGIAEPLVRMNERFEVEPALAERWEYSKETNTYRFSLRRGVLFHDGGELTADDVKYTLDLVNQAIPENDEALATPETVKVVDRYTVEFTPVRTNTRLVEGIAPPLAAINRKGSDPDKPVGTGPYRFVEYVKNDRLVVERFEGYWDSSRSVKARRITFRFIGDPQTRVLALRSGEVDMIIDVPRDQAPQLEAPGLKLLRAPPGSSDGLVWNIAGTNEHVVGRDPRVREAVAAAIDRASLLPAVWGRNGELSPTVLPSAVLGPSASQIKGPSYDLARAGRLLDEAGYRPGADGTRSKDGRRLTLDYVVGFPPSDHAPGPELIQQQLKQVGIDVRLKVPSDEAVLSAQARDGAYDLRQRTFVQDEPHPCRIPERFHSRIGGSARFYSPGGATDLAIEGCRTSVGLEESRRQASEAIRQLVDVEHVIIPLAAVSSLSATKDTVAGFTPHPSSVNQRWGGVHLVR